MSGWLPLRMLENVRKENGELRAFYPQPKSCPRDSNVSVAVERETYFLQRKGPEF